MILLDTHVWIWVVSNPENLSKKAKQYVKTAIVEKGIIISSISAWEVALLVVKNRLKLKLNVNDWITRSETLPFIQFIPVDNSVAVQSVNLPEPIHSDPADRIIIATAISMGIPVVTKDEKILNYPHVQSVW